MTDLAVLIVVVLVGAIAMVLLVMSMEDEPL
jgi:hypothetical protein